MNAQVISFNCVLKNKAGRLLSSTFNRDILNINLAGEHMLEGLTKGMENLSEGEHRSILLSAEQAYGLYDPKKVILFPRKKLPDDARVGMTIFIRGKSGTTRMYKVLDMTSPLARLDGNHPLAGQDLIVEIEALKVRQATTSEIEEALNPLGAQILH
ncbi:MAG: FKBP-type peptidyl-prolyl cis-trans isomerase [Bacillota bacterium]